MVSKRMIKSSSGGGGSKGLSPSSSSSSLNGEEKMEKLEQQLSAVRQAVEKEGYNR